MEKIHLGRWKLRLSLLWVLTAGFILGACGAGDNPGVLVEGGDPQIGQERIDDYGCGGCHTIPGIRYADATVGPPLDRWAERIYIAGNLVNNPDNLMAWIMAPQVVEPGTAMPDLGVSAEDARHIAAYLFSLENNR